MMNTAIGSVTTMLIRISPRSESVSPKVSNWTYCGIMFAWAGTAMPRTKNPKSRPLFQPVMRAIP